MIQVIQPKIGERIYDGAVGSAGFLCEAHDYMRPDIKNAKELTILQTKTFYGKEKKSLAYVIAIMNMILHGVDAPNILHTNTLSENIKDIQDKDRFDIAFNLAPITRQERVNTHKGEIMPQYDEKLQTFLHFVLDQYIQEGVSELDKDKLPQLLELKYKVVGDAVLNLGGVTRIREAFIGFQKMLY